MFVPWNWDWNMVCPTGLTPWIPGTNNLAPCFQQICLQLPILALIAVVSAYHFGRRCGLVVRNNVQIRVLYLRIVTVLCLAFVPILKTYYYLTYELTIYPSDIVVSCTECISWIVHCGLLLSLRSHGGRSHRGCLILGVLWSVIAVLSIIWLRTSIIYRYWPCPTIVVILHIFYGISLIPSGEARFINPRNTDEDERQALLGNHYSRFQEFDVEYLGHAYDGVSYLSKLFFYWVNPLIDKGVEGLLKKIDDVFDLPESLSIIRTSQRLQTALHNSKSLIRALHRSFGWQFYTIGILRLISDMSGFAGPLLLGGLLKQKTSSNEGTDSTAYLYALGLFSASLISAFCLTHFNWKMALITMKMRIGLVTAIYSKTLEAKTIKNAPDILNLMSTDTDRIVNSCASFHAFWSIPFQLFTTLYLLYLQIGLVFLSGVVFAIALIPINRWIALKIGIYSGNLMTAKDSRVSASSEALAGARQIKMHAWEDVFINKIENLREEEIKYLSKRKYLDAICVYFWATTPVLMSLLTFGLSALLGNPLTAATTYTSVALLNMLIGPLNAFPWVLNGLTEAWVSLKRVQELIDLKNIDLSMYYSSPHQAGKGNIVISTDNAEFDYETKIDRTNEELNQDHIVDFKLKDINIDIKKGELIVVTGAIGEGKSSLLSAIIGDLNLNRGEIYVKDLEKGFGYASQTPWLQRGTIRDNILWGALYDETRYKTVIKVCALEEDIEILGGDHKGVGEAGHTLSGGQKARVALARCIYQDKQIYILDDVLAALDAHVASFIIQKCILGFLKHKTRIIVSEHKLLFRNANRIFVMNEGTLTEKDTTNILEINEDEENELNEGKNKMFDIDLHKKTNRQEEFDNKSIDSILLEETKETGKLKSSVLLAYWKATTGWLGTLVLLFVVLMQASRNVSDAWLAEWVAENTNTSSNNSSNSSLEDDLNLNNDQNYYLGIYAGLVISNSLLTFARAFLFAYAGIKAAKYIHKLLLRRVFATKFEFFDTTPLGRILNRFSSDTYTIDDSLPFILNILLAQLSGLLGSIAISLYAMPWLALLIVPLCPIYLNLQNRYRHASRDIKRLSSNSLSPLYAHFTETLQGLSTIRAMRAANRFRQNFSIKLEESIRVQLTSSAAQQWLGLRLQLLGTLMVGGAGLLSAITSAHATNPSYVGLAISYALSVTSLLNGLLNAIAETEQELVAVERVDEYCKLKGEVNAKGSATPPFGWPCQGIVTFKDVSLKYRENLDNALSNLSFETKSCETVGIVGRTGAGKSSILAGILRTTPVSGTIQIDSVNIATLPLDILRNRISVVPQEPFLFAGTIRENLDPRNYHLDTEIWNAINKCFITTLVQSLGGLNANIERGGSNLSAGQKQLLCLTRTMLKNSKIVCIDEGTANLDSESEKLIQAVLTIAFKTSTVILIAHRLNGLKHAKRIIVMDKGQIYEEGPPKELANDKNSLFYQMLEQQMNSEFRD